MAHRFFGQRFASILKAVGLLAAVWVLVDLKIVAAEVGEAAWSFQTLGEIFAAPAIAEDGCVFFGSRDGSVYAVESDGELRWEFVTGDWVDCAPTINREQSVLYVGSWDNKLYAVDILTGAKLWEFETGSLVVASPALDEFGNLYFGSSDGFFYSLNTGGEMRWAYFVGAEMDSTPAVSETGEVFVGAYDSFLYAFSLDGEFLWEFETREQEDENDYRIAGPVSLGENGEVFFGGGDGYVYALDRFGNKLWDFETYEKVDTGVVVSGSGDLIFASRSGYVYSLDAFGVMQWESFVGDVFYSTPAVDDTGSIYVGSYIGNGISSLTVLDRDGEVIWEYLLLDYIDSPPVFDYEGRVLFGCYDGALYAVEADASPATSHWHRFGADRENSGNALSVAPDWATQKFSAWLEGVGLLGARPDLCLDLDGDGKALALEYLLGGDPGALDGSGLDIGLGTYEGELRIYIEHNWIAEDPGFPGALELWLEDEANWRPLDEVSGVSYEVVSEDSYGDGWYRTVREYLPDLGAGGVLVRVKVRCD